MRFYDWLRGLAPDEQVGLLFVLMFGVLAVGSLTALWLSLRRHDHDETHERHVRLKRDLRAVWVSAVVFWVSWVSGAAGATLLFAVISFLALREYITLAPTRRADHRSLVVAFFFALPAQYLLVATSSFDLFSVFIPVYVFFAIPVVGALAGDPERFLERHAKIQWGLTVCVYGLSHAPALLLLDFPGHEGRGAFLVFFLVVVAAGAQLVQEATSRMLRRRPIARQIDRSFSARAFGAGAAGAALLGGLLFWITPFGALQAVAIGALAGAAGTLGEFVMKALKADAGVKTWGNQGSITGAVGLLDRVAPLCFAAPVFFHSVRWYFELGA